LLKFLWSTGLHALFLLSRTMWSMIQKGREDSTRGDNKGKKKKQKMRDNGMKRVKRV